ncbi:uncharacterized protein CBL_12261 [Carabus blaptoides fortunei]
MSSFNRSMDNSETSTTEDRDDSISEEERNVRIFATQMLKSRIFLGHFQERRYVDAIQAYRDVICINDSEHVLKKDVDLVRKKLRTHYGYNFWVGLTAPDFVGSPRGHCLWVESGNTAFGGYWYKIRGVRFHRNEVTVRLKVVRAMTSNDTIGNQQSQSLDNMTNILDNISWDALLENAKNTASENIKWFFTTVLTANNIKEAITFLSVFIATSVALSVKGIAFLMNFALRFMRETSILIQSSTPVMISVVNLIGKIFGGFYLLIAMMWRDSKRPSSGPEYRSLDTTRYNRRAIGYKRSSPIITEIE